MPETPRTMDASARWVDEKSVHQGADTRHFLFAHEGDLLVKESPKSELAPETGSSLLESIEASAGTVWPSFLRIPLPRAQRVSTHPDDRYILLKKYDGVVTFRGDETFTARLFENASDYPVLEAEFDVEELSENDRSLAVEGAPLVWTIGYRYEGSTRKRESTIYLRRLPRLSDAEIEQNRRSVEQLVRDIHWE